MRVHVWPDADHWVDDHVYAAVVAIADEAEIDIRRHLPLERDLYLFVRQTDQVIPETGGGGYTIGPHCIRWDVDPARGIVAVAETSLRATLFHECHHAVRLQQRPEDAQLTDWVSVAVFEGLASVFEDASGTPRASWRSYDPAVIAAWAAELFSAPIDATWPQWKFDHPDGRRNIAYKVGSWVVDRATARSGRTAAELVWATPADVLRLAGVTAG